MTDDTTMDYHAMLAGIGIAFLPAPVVEEDLHSGRVEQVLLGYAMPAVPLFAAYTSHRYLTPKVRIFIDFLSVALKSCGEARAA